MMTKTATGNAIAIGGKHVVSFVRLSVFMHKRENGIMTVFLTLVHIHKYVGHSGPH
jgi:hypothetical protein